MTRKQFLLALAVLAILIAAAAWVVVSEREPSENAEARIGQKVIPGLKMSDVAEIAIRDESGELHLVRAEGGWKVREREGFPADVDRIGEMLLGLAELKVVQAEPLPESQRARLLLAEPKAKGAKDTGTVLELKDAKGALLAHLLLGKKVFRKTEIAALGGREEGLPSGRYLLAGQGGGTMIVVGNPFVTAEPKADLWLSKDLIRADRVKSIQSLGPDGKQRWMLVRDSDSAEWRFAGSKEAPDLQKATDAAGSFGWMNLVDVVVDPAHTETGLSSAVTVKAETFDGLTYTVRIGARTGDNYYVALSVAGELPNSRTPTADEKPEDKEKKDKEFEAQRQKILAQLAREKALDQWRYIVAKVGVEPLLRERADMLPAKKTPAKRS
jgi:hypothetical protein